MSSSVVITIVVIAAIVWLSVLAVSALRSRGSEEVASNLAPGEPDEFLETKRLERTQQAAVVLSAFLAVGLPLYYLGETNRQAQFEEDFHEQSVELGLEHWEEFQCASCHGADGGGGVATYIEPRTGVSVAWAAPSVNDVFYRYSRDSVRYWLIYGRQNSPMPAWGQAGGGPMTDSQIEELLDYMESEEFVISQAEAASKVEGNITAALANIDGADAAMAAAIVDQRQRVQDIQRSLELAPVLEVLDDRALDLVESLGDGLDTDGDGVADAAEEAVNALTAEVRQALLLPGVEAVALDPANPTSVDGVSDADRAQAILATYRDLSADGGAAPVLGSFADAVEAAIGSTEGDDTDGDGLTDTAEAQISAQTSLAVAAVTGDFNVTSLDPTNPETVAGQSDLLTAEEALSSVGTRFTNAQLNVENFDRLSGSAQASLDNLLAAQDEAKWAFGFEAVAEQSFGGDVDRARRVVGIYQAYCARCHTSGWSAGLPFAQHAGSGGFGPALYEGRAALQFLTDEDLAGFLTEGGIANQAYGVNGMSKENAPMPGFGTVLSEEDILDLASWLRDGDLTGRGES